MPKEDEQQVEETVQTETQEQVEDTTEKTAEEQVNEQETDKKSETVVEEPVKTWKIKHNGEEIELDEAKLLENASKGFDYTSKMQKVSEIEKNYQQQTQQMQSFQNDPDALRLMIAKQSGVNPRNIFVEPIQPNPAMIDYDPQGYYKQLADYEVGIKERAFVNNALNVLVQQQANGVNNAIVSKAKLKYDDVPQQDFDKMVNWATDRIRPNQHGIYPEDSLDVAYKALFGDKKQQNEKLQTANKLVESIKKNNGKVASQSNRASVASSQESADNDFLKYVEDTSPKRK
jgi:hypothetical protein